MLASQTTSTAPSMGLVTITYIQFGGHRITRFRDSFRPNIQMVTPTIFVMMALLYR